MKLVVAIIHSRDRNRVADALVKEGIKSTVLGSTGGFLREGNTTLLIGIPDERLPRLKEVLRENSCAREQIVNVAPYEGAATGGFLPAPLKVPVGGAVIFVIDVDEFDRF